MLLVDDLRSQGAITRMGEVWENEIHPKILLV